VLPKPVVHQQPFKMLASGLERESGRLEEAIMREELLLFAVWLLSILPMWLFARDEQRQELVEHSSARAVQDEDHFLDAFVCNLHCSCTTRRRTQTLSPRWRRPSTQTASSSSRYICLGRVGWGGGAQAARALAIHYFRKNIPY
jgi:hypothetical protein